MLNVVSMHSYYERLIWVLLLSIKCPGSLHFAQQVLHPPSVLMSNCARLGENHGVVNLNEHEILDGLSFVSLPFIGPELDITVAHTSTLPTNRTPLEPIVLPSVVFGDPSSLDSAGNISRFTELSTVADEPEEMDPLIEPTEGAKKKR
jgi:hypothetical protein